MDLPVQISLSSRYDRRRTTYDKGRATRNRVLDAATELVFQHGVAGTTLDDVRAAANVSKGQLYHYFADKDDLVHAVIDRTVEQVLDAQPALPTSPPGPRSPPGSTTSSSYRSTVTLSGDARSAASPASSPKQTNKPARSSPPALTAGRRHCGKGFDRCRRNGKLRRSADPARLATATLAAIQGGLVLTQTRRDPQQLRIALDAAYAYLRSFAA